MANALFYTSRQTVRLSTTAPSGSSSLSTFPLTELIPSGTTLTFNGAGLSAPVQAILSSSGVVGASTLNVSPISAQINVLSVAYQASKSPDNFTLPLVDSAWVQGNRDRFRRSFLADIEKANAFYSPAGRWPGVGWILVRRQDYDDPNRQSIFNAFQYAINLKLQIDDVDPNFPPVTLNHISIVQARCVTTGNENDPNAVYLVQLTDSRGVVSSPWMDFPVNVQFNVRSPAYPGSYYDGSLNMGVPWTWNTMVAYLWNQMGEFLGPYPNLPATPTGTPENYIFPGMSCWNALNKILDTLGMVIAVDLTKDNPYTIVISGADDPIFDNLQSEFIGQIEDDFQYIDTGSGRVPRFVTVLFHQRYQYYGTEETVRKDSLQWQSNFAFPVIIDAFTSFGIFQNATGQAFIWDDFTVQLDINGVPLPSDVLTANAIALERVAQFYDKIHNGTEGSMRQLYAGALPFFTGSNCDGVCWYQNYRTNDLAHTRRAGWRTEVLRGYVWPEVREIPSDVSLRFAND